MGDLIRLNCPSCGGKLEIKATTSVMNCQHCGSEHIVRRDGSAVILESHARCPKCGRNDKSQKLSSLVKSKINNQSFHTAITAPKKPSIILSPQNLTVPLIFLLITGAIIFTLVLILLIVLLIEENILTAIYLFGFVPSILILITIALFLLIIVFDRNVNKKANEKKKIKYQVLLSNWREIYQRWNLTYYCHRDDIVFVPNEGSFSSVEKIHEFFKKA